MRTIQKLGFSPLAFGLDTQRARQRGYHRGVRGIGQVNLTAAQQAAIIRAGNMPLQRSLQPSSSGTPEEKWWQTKTAKVAGVGVGVALLAVLVLT